MIPVVKGKTKVKFALTIPNGTQKILVKEQIDTPPDVALKTVKILSI